MILQSGVTRAGPARPGLGGAERRASRDSRAGAGDPTRRSSGARSTSDRRADRGCCRPRRHHRSPVVLYINLQAALRAAVYVQRNGSPGAKSLPTIQPQRSEPPPQGRMPTTPSRLSVSQRPSTGLPHPVRPHRAWPCGAPAIWPARSASRGISGRTMRRHLAGNWGERWDSNPRHPRPQPGALPTELRPPSRTRRLGQRGPRRQRRVNLRPAARP